MLLTRFLNQAPLETFSQSQGRRHGDSASGPAVKQLLIVARDRQKLHQYVKRAFSDNPSVEVILDRRSAEPRNANRMKTPERRRDEHQFEIADHLKALGWAVVRPDVLRIAGPSHHSGLN